MKLAFEEFKIKVEMMPEKDANQYRAEYIKKFINIDSDHYKKYILRL
ncbi:MAG: hypothetical protein H6Q69_1694 [Firmicutes bacterium]|nr:hypothetical protein [Bacillota bacterium]